MASRSRNSPTEATTFAIGGAMRSGRKTKKCRISPSTMQNTSEMTSAGQNDMLDPNEIFVGMSGRWKLWLPAIR